ncbi:Zinc finger GRF-type protein [Arachis hypogaea]|nr:Zinc finger GRF-type protein [Arachis hypogaea]
MSHHRSADVASVCHVGGLQRLVELANFLFVPTLVPPIISNPKSPNVHKLHLFFLFIALSSFFRLGLLLLSMMSGGSTAGGSSVRSPSSWNRTRTPTKSRRPGPPEWCGCGCRPVLRWSGTESNPNKPFYGCPNYNVG